MAITLTESAAKQIQAQLANRGKGVGLRVGVKKVGCSGLAYTFDYADEVRASDQLFEAHKVVVEGVTLEEGVLVTVLTKDNEGGFTLSLEEEAELLLSIAEADREETVSAEEVLARLARRHR